MSTDHTTRLPDPVYGSADAGPSTDVHRLRVMPSADGGPLLHAQIGGVYVAMSERNWRQLYTELGKLAIGAAHAITHRITFDDDAHEVTISSVTA